MDTGTDPTAFYDKMTEYMRWIELRDALENNAWMLGIYVVYQYVRVAFGAKLATYAQTYNLRKKRHTSQALFASISRRRTHIINKIRILSYIIQEVRCQIARDITAKQLAKLQLVTTVNLLTRIYLQLSAEKP